MMFSWLLASVLPLSAGAEVSFMGPPRQVVERQTVALAVRYDVPQSLGPVPLTTELKDGAGQVVAHAESQVQGSGVHQARFSIPSLLNTDRVQFVVWLGNDWEHPLAPVVHSPAARIISQARAASLAEDRQRAPREREALLRMKTTAGLVGLYRGQRPPSALAANLRAAGFGLVELTPEQLANSGLLTPDVVDLLVLEEPRQMPAEAMENIDDFVRAGGNMAVLGTGLFSDLQYSLGDKSLPRAEYLAAVSAALPKRTLLNFDNGEPLPWSRSSNTMESPSAANIERPGANGSAAAVRIEITNLRGWDTFATPELTTPFQGDESWTCFWAKGGPGTTQLAVEWEERDQSRWIAVVDLGHTWRPYALPPSAFKHWAGPTNRLPSTGFQPQNAKRLVIGLADTHTKQVGHGAHTLFFDELAVAAPPVNHPEAAALTAGDGAVYPIEACSPAYKIYSVTTATKWRAGRGVTMPRGTPLPPMPDRLSSPHPRPEGTTIGRHRNWRFAGLLECIDRDGQICGTPAALVLNGPDTPSGGAVLSVTIDDADWWADQRTQRWLTAVCSRIIDGVYFYEAGARYYASFGGETMPIGALISNRGARAAQVTVTATVKGPGQPLWRRVWQQAVEPQSLAEVSADWVVPLRGGPFEVAVELQSPTATDRLSHQVRLWQPKMQPRFMTAARGDFYDGGRKWYAHGVNYMPSSGIATEDGAYFEHWISGGSYDAAIIQRDLERIKRIGFNMVSVFMYYPQHLERNMLDLIMRCEDLGLKVNLSLRPGTPLDFEWDKVREMITAQRLAENDTVIAYDLAWEPNWGTRVNLARWDGEWAQWLADRYGSVAQAEAKWGCEARREDGQVVGPSDEQLSDEGPWRPMVVDYREFLNDLIRKYYGRARSLVQSVDPNHLVSYRMSGAGDPLWTPPMTTYDFQGLRDAVDFMAPEAYGRLGPWENVKVGLWTIAYSRACAPDHPVIWAELGNTVWSTALNGPNPERLASQGKFYDDFYRMCDMANGNGTVCWWYPGGFRVGENSDYGIIDPDGAWRPATHQIHNWAARLTRSRTRPRPDVVIPLDQTRSVRGINGLYVQSEAEYWKAIDAGQTVALSIKDLPKP